MLTGYLIYMQLSNDAAHPSITSLDRHVLIQGGQAESLFVPSASAQELSDTLMSACLGIIGICVACSQLLQNARLNADIEALAEEYAKIAKS